MHLTALTKETYFKKKKKKKGPKKADKVRNLTLSLGEALSLIMKEEVNCFVK